MYKIEAENVYEDFYKDKELTSVITGNIQNHAAMANDLVLCKMKDETSACHTKFGNIKILNIYLHNRRQS